MKHSLCPKYFMIYGPDLYNLKTKKELNNEKLNLTFQNIFIRCIGCTISRIKIRYIVQSSQL